MTGILDYANIIQKRESIFLKIDYKRRSINFYACLNMFLDSIQIFRQILKQ